MPHFIEPSVLANKVMQKQYEKTKKSWPGHDTGFLISQIARWQRRNSVARWRYVVAWVRYSFCALINRMRIGLIGQNWFVRIRWSWNFVCIWWNRRHMLRGSAANCGQMFACCCHRFGRWPTAWTRLRNGWLWCRRLRHQTLSVLRISQQVLVLELLFHSLNYWFHLKPNFLLRNHFLTTGWSDTTE